MSGRDFFAFCTSLQPLERRALGSLSQVRHVLQGETIYLAGSASDALFIINRGMVEMRTEEDAAAIYLSRGDVFGDLEVLADLPRRHRVRTCADVSLQTFQQSDFPELVRRVPSFFRYLSERLATRLLQAHDLALSRSHCLGLSGSLRNFDLVTVFQTIMNSSQTGELSILDEHGEPVSAFAFENGQLRGGEFQHLIGEEAFFQLFLADELTGSFSFAARTQPAGGGSITRSLNELLVEAVRARDEYQILRAEFPDAAAEIQRTNSTLALSKIAPLDRALAEEIWNFTEFQPVRLDRLYLQLRACELKIYQATSELLRTEQLAPSVRLVAHHLA